MVQNITLLRTLVMRELCAGMTVTVYDPDRDPLGACAALIVEILTNVFRHNKNLSTEIVKEQPKS